ncbi:sulfite exporter TauE/SafE family protein [Oscillibacter sp. MSJ-2]|uniref:Probable membrane transporter protein n=1 Tax=Dysosmobacter acutus TaxID=2841504 RepID=A0ABS6F861_9FIRM|nr:sulfite exporter TauE/SafE family protein [Dysosmobacter acutus]MBU5626478.1 sulfite exporter TauE/SafE family protein [Dysosmobacter acutus]
MTLTLPMVLIAVVGVFLASFVDAIAGGGGIVSLPTYLLAGLPMHMALGTNKVSASLGSIASTGRFLKNGYVTWSLALPAVVLALTGSALGTRLQLLIDEKYLQLLLLIVLPVVAFVVLRQRSFPEEPGEIDPKKQAAVVLAAALVIGSYDGFYGPGTGTFLLLIFTRWGKMDVRTAGGNVKVVNLASGLSSMVTAMLHGQVFWQLGLIATAASFAGHFVGAGLAIRNGSRIVRPVVLVVLVLLAVKVLSGLL